MSKRQIGHDGGSDEDEDDWKEGRGGKRRGREKESETTIKTVLERSTRGSLGARRGSTAEAGLSYDKSVAKVGRR